MAVTDLATARREPALDTARLCLLGGFELRLGGELVELPQSAERLVAFLALHPRPLARVFVAGRLWTDASEEQANASLRSVLWRLRARTPVVCATSTRVSLKPWLSTDVADADELASRLTDDGPAPTRADVLTLSTGGELLPDWYDDWLLVERERVRQRHLHSLEAACRRLTLVGRYAEALEAGLAAVAADPLRETGHAVVMQAHLAEGNLIEASRQYERLRDLLGEHLGTHPSTHVGHLLRDAQLRARCSVV